MQSTRLPPLRMHTSISDTREGVPGKYSPEDVLGSGETGTVSSGRCSGRAFSPDLNHGCPQPAQIISTTHMPHRRIHAPLNAYWCISPNQATVVPRSRPASGELSSISTSTSLTVLECPIRAQLGNHVVRRTRQKCARLRTWSHGPENEQSRPIPAIRLVLKSPTGAP